MKRRTTMLRMIAFAGFIFVTQIAAAAPKQAEAEQWLSDFRRERDKVHDALLINNSSKWGDHDLILRVLVNRAEELFGDPLGEPYGACVQAAHSLRNAWDNQKMALNSRMPLSNIQISGLSRGSWDGGISYWDCRMAIEPDIAADKLKQVSGRK
jgi:hypothetical protein